MTAQSRPGLSIVLPCYNEAITIPWLAERVAQGRPDDVAVELVLVDNGSSDNTPDVLARLIAMPAFDFVRSVRVTVNKGYGHGILTGLQYARGEYLAWSHADRQCDPVDAVRAFRALKMSARPDRTIVKGARQRRSASAMALTLGMQCAARLILREPLRDINAQPKVFHRSLLACVTAPPADFNFDLYVLSQALRAGWQIESVPVVFDRRAHGQSRWASSWTSRWKHIVGALRFMLRERARTT